MNRTPHKLYDYIAGLPADPDALLARVRRDYHDKGRDVTTFGVISRIFRDDHLIPPKANATLYRALAKIPNVRVVNNTTDLRRHGMASEWSSTRGEKRNGGPVTETIVLNSRRLSLHGGREPRRSSPPPWSTNRDSAGDGDPTARTPGVGLEFLAGGRDRHRAAPATRLRREPSPQTGEGACSWFFRCPFRWWSIVGRLRLLRCAATGVSSGGRSWVALSGQGRPLG